MTQATPRTERQRLQPRLAAACIAALLAALATTAASEAGTLDSIRETGQLKIGFRDDAAPFSFVRDGQPAGYSVALCRAVGGALQQRLELETLDIAFTAVTVEDRFDALKQGRIDLLCGATTVTLQRREEVDFSLLTFITGASVLYRQGGPSSFTALEGEKVGVRSGTTTDEGLRRALSEAGIGAEVVAIASHEAGRDALESGEIAAYFADRAILIMLAREAAEPADLVLSQRFFSYEPYALALRRDDGDFRMEVDRALVKTYRTPTITEIYEANFGKARMSELLRAMYTLQSLPD
ncbi:amino acid ABC transporter substrate-binding protein [Pelagibius sp.]|uniref:amino acid ABC transporter substrate-binding protein n=1 Tax=Pelagibius sp. TaxID=1931238 RepID=UPI003B508F3A